MLYCVLQCCVTPYHRPKVTLNIEIAENTKLFWLFKKTKYINAINTRK